jgi:hypothetical protein
MKLKFSGTVQNIAVLKVPQKVLKKHFYNDIKTINIIILIMHHCGLLVSNALQWVPFKENQFNKLNSYFVKFRGCK